MGELEYLMLRVLKPKLFCDKHNSNKRTSFVPCSVTKNILILQAYSFLLDHGLSVSNKVWKRVTREHTLVTVV